MLIEVDFVTREKQRETVLGCDRAVTLFLIGDAAWRCSQKESRPAGALRLTIPCDPGLNALGYRISPLWSVPGDCVAAQWEQNRPQVRSIEAQLYTVALRSRGGKLEKRAC